jgi:glycogen/starch/alpha-glucan phosphorylases
VELTLIDKNYEENKEMIKEGILQKLRHHFGKTLEDATKPQVYKACAMMVRDEIMEKWTRSQEQMEKTQGKKLYYLSVEFLMGRALGNNLMNILKQDVYRDVLKELDINLDELMDVERDAGLGNGGLGRLAACFLDSLTTLGYPAVGCGIRYEYGLFKQRIIDGFQVEMPDSWLEDGNVWEIAKPEEAVEVRFGGQISERWEEGGLKTIHEGYKSIMAVPYDVPITGYNSNLVNSLRLWKAVSPKHIDMDLFSRGDYLKATAEKELSETISKVLYPEDNHIEGKALRLKQHYFFVSATIQRIIKDVKKEGSIISLPEKVAIHINDTHPSLAVPELMRLLIDQEGLNWDDAWNITVRTIAYTNHTIMGEALERWPVALFKDLLPRIYTIINEINERFTRDLWNIFPGDWNRISTMAIVAYDEIRMANLSIVGSHSVNGVSALHTKILKDQVFKDFYRVYPDRFLNITNGITHRRWLLYANPNLSKLITGTIGDGWILNSMELKNLEKYGGDKAFREQFKNVKKSNKEALAKYIYGKSGIMVDTDSIFDVQIKRLHEYKRQLLNIFRIMYIYNRLIENPGLDIYPRTFIFGAKASPGYHMAKLIIKLINNLSLKVNNDDRVNKKIKIVFLEDYGVSLAERIIPACEVSEQISTAGMEASGTSNMKLMQNGALTVGTLDGANVEIMDAVGPENIYIFGLKADRVSNLKNYNTYQPREIYERNNYLKEILDQLISGFLDVDNPGLFKDINHSLLYGNGQKADNFMVLMDFESYIHIHERVDRDYRNEDLWWKKAIINTANSGIFSSDRSIEEYNANIWNLRKCKLEGEL